MIYVLYHANCYDGFGAAWAAYRHFGADKSVYKAVKYGDPLPDMDAGSEIYIVDFSYPKETILKLRESHKKVVVIDHHKTAQKDLEGLDDCIFDTNHSGAWLTWFYFNPLCQDGITAGEYGVPEFIQYIEDRDLWIFKLPNSKEFSAALRSYPFSFQGWDTLSQSIEKLKQDGISILRHTQTMVDIMCESAKLKLIGGHAVPVVNATVYFSEVGEQLCRLFPDAHFSAYYLDRNDGKRQWGLRSRNGFDVSAIAKLYGGGGHQGAAGFVEPAPCDHIGGMEAK